MMFSVSRVTQYAAERLNLRKGEHGIQNGLPCTRLSRPLFSVGANGAESRVRGRQIWRPFHPDVQILPLFLRMHPLGAPISRLSRHIRWRTAGTEGTSGAKRRIGILVDKAETVY